MKIAYFGIDALSDCLEYLIKSGNKVVKIFTYSLDEYDETSKVIAISKKYNIELKTEKATKEDIEELEKEGVELSITAGYAGKIPVTKKFMQVNIHPSMLPVGRGAWPMPCTILKNINSGVTFHKLTEKFDEGDIILQREIPLSKDENLESLMEKIKITSLELLKEFIKDPETFFKNSKPQGKGEYWKEPGDEERTIYKTDSKEITDRKNRAFYGYGCLYMWDNVPWECKVKNGEVIPTKPYFKEITLADRDKIEKIRKAHPPIISAYTFSSLFSWRSEYKIKVCLGEDFYFVKSGDDYYFPIGSDEIILDFLKKFSKKEKIIMHFAGEREKELIEQNFDSVKVRFDRNDCDYYIDNKKISELKGGKFEKMRNATHHYQRLDPPPVIEEITDANIGEVKELSKKAHQAHITDFYAENQCIDHFKELKLNGLLIRRGGKPVAFTIYDEKDEDVAQGQFMKSLDKERGAMMFLVKSYAEKVVLKYPYSDIEEDLGEEGLREFKMSLQSTIAPSYTVTLEKTR